MPTCPLGTPSDNSNVQVPRRFKKFGHPWIYRDATTPLEEFDAEDEIPLAAYAEMQRAFVALGRNNIDPDDFINLDAQLFVENDDSDSAIKDAADDIPPEEVNEEIEDDEIDCLIKNNVDAITAVRNLKSFAKNQGDLKAYELETNIEAYYANLIFKAKHQKKQTTLTDFFQKNT
ncbi:hypothetical protein FQA39_LY05751 [Lamprigera yunnana]|nr:hypothetical protein FQA39_LY05751 [Lamprigera yunnana]